MHIILIQMQNKNDQGSENDMHEALLIGPGRIPHIGRNGCGNIFQFIFRNHWLLSRDVTLHNLLQPEIRRL